MAQAWAASASLPRLARRLIEEGKGRAVAARMIGVDPATLRRALKGLDDLGGS